MSSTIPTFHSIRDLGKSSIKTISPIFIRAEPLPLEALCYSRKLFKYSSFHFDLKCVNNVERCLLRWFIFTLYSFGDILDLTSKFNFLPKTK